MEVAVVVADLVWVEDSDVEAVEVTVDVADADFVVVAELATVVV